MEIVAMVQKAAGITGRVVAGCDERSLKRRSPCRGWTGHDVLNHLVGGLILFASVARGDAPAGGGPEFPDVLGDDPDGAYERACGDLIEQMSRKGALEKSYGLPTGDLPGRVVAGIALLELCVHGWDLARATGQEILLPRDVAKTLDATSQMLVTDGFRKPPFFGARRQAPEGASVLEKVAAFTGRKV